MSIMGFPWSGVVQTGSAFGGGGGNRTRVRKSSTVSSTYLAWLFDLAAGTPTGGLANGESPWI